MEANSATAPPRPVLWGDESLFSHVDPLLRSPAVVSEDLAQPPRLPSGSIINAKNTAQSIASVAPPTSPTGPSNYGDDAIDSGSSGMNEAVANAVSLIPDPESPPVSFGCNVPHQEGAPASVAAPTQYPQLEPLKSDHTIVAIPVSSPTTRAPILETVEASPLFVSPS
jgi:hypothetical protein